MEASSRFKGRNGFEHRLEVYQVVNEHLDISFGEPLVRTAKRIQAVGQDDGIKELGRRLVHLGQGREVDRLGVRIINSHFWEVIQEPIDGSKLRHERARLQGHQLKSSWKS